MKKRKLNACIFMAFALILGTIFYLDSVFPQDFGAYFNSEYYYQFGPIAICVELFIAGIYLLKGHKSTNFALALFAFTALLDPIFNLAGIFSTIVPVYASIIFVVCAMWSLYLAFTNTFNLGRVSWLEVIGSFVFGVIIELSFNYFYQYL